LKSKHSAHLQQSLDFAIGPRQRERRIPVLPVMVVGARYVVRSA
jgi:hypothetical protein